MNSEYTEQYIQKHHIQAVSVKHDHCVDFTHASCFLAMLYTVCCYFWMHLQHVVCSFNYFCLIENLIYVMTRHDKTCFGILSEYQGNILKKYVNTTLFQNFNQIIHNPNRSWWPLTSFVTLPNNHCVQVPRKFFNIYMDTMTIL